MLPGGVELERRFARGAPLNVIGQQDGQFVLRDGVPAAFLAIDHRDRRAPVTLARDQPVVQAIVHVLPADALLFQPVNHRGDAGIFAPFGVGDARAVERAAVDHHTGADVGFLHRRAVQVRLAFRLNDGDDLQVVLTGELEVALVVRRDSHDRSRTIGHQDVIRDPDRDARLVDRVDGITAGEHAGLLLIHRLALDVTLAGGLQFVGFHLLPVFIAGHFIHQRMLRGEHHEGRAPQRIRPGGEDLHRIAVFGVKDHRGPLGTSDPVGLQRLDALGPIQAGKVQQLIGVIGDAEEPLLQMLLDHRRTAAFTVTVFPPHLLARQRSVATGAKIHRRQGAVGQPVLEQLDEEPLRPLVIFGVGGDRLAPPVEHRTHAAQLHPHALDVGIRPLFRVDVALDRRPFCGQAKSVESHGEHHVIALHAHVAGAGVARRHGVPVADVKIAGGIGQHGQGVVLGARGIDISVVQPVGFPTFLPFGFDGGGIVLWGHSYPPYTR